MLAAGSLILISLLGCDGGSSSAPEATTPAPAPAPAPAPVPAVIPAPAPSASRAVVYQGNILACLKDGQAQKGEDCAGDWSLVEVAPADGGPLQLSVAPGTGTRTEDPPCDWLVNARPSGAAQQITLGREVTVLPTDSATYKKLLEEVTGVKNITITALVKVDLEGDGKDEVLFSANSHPDGFPFGQKGLSYSYVGMRYVGDDDAAKTLMFFTHNQQMSGESPMDHLAGRLLGFTDLEGDGRLEVVYEDGYYEGSSWTVATRAGDQAVVLGSAGCGA